MGKLLDDYNASKGTAPAPEALAPTEDVVAPAPTSPPLPGAGGDLPPPPEPAAPVAPTRPDYMGPELAGYFPTGAPLTTAAKGEHAGKVGFSQTKARSKVLQDRKKARVQEYYREHGEAPSADQLKKWHGEEWRYADQLVKEWANARSGTSPVPFNVLFFDEDPSGIHESLADWVQTGAELPSDYGSVPELMVKSAWSGGLSAVGSPETYLNVLSGGGPDSVRSDIRQVVAPFIASTLGQATTTTMQGPDGPETQTYNEAGLGFGSLDWYSRMSPGSWLATAARAGGADKPGDMLNPLNYIRGWGTPEHLSLLERGEDYITLANELNLGDFGGMHYIASAANAAGLVSKDTQARWENRGDFVAAMGLALMDPDILTVSTAGLGKVVKIEQVLSEAARATTKSRNLHKWADEVKELEDAVKGGDLERQAEAPELLSRLQKEVRDSKTGLGPAGHRMTRMSASSRISSGRGITDAGRDAAVAAEKAFVRDTPLHAEIAGGYKAQEAAFAGKAALHGDEAGDAAREVANIKARLKRATAKEGLPTKTAPPAEKAEKAEEAGGFARPEGRYEFLNDGDPSNWRVYESRMLPKKPTAAAKTKLKKAISAAPPEHLAALKHVDDLTRSSGKLPEYADIGVEHRTALSDMVTSGLIRQVGRMRFEVNPLLDVLTGTSKTGEPVAAAAAAAKAGPKADKIAAETKALSLAQRKLARYRKRARMSNSKATMASARLPLALEHLSAAAQVIDAKKGIEEMELFISGAGIDKVSSLLPAKKAKMLEDFAEIFRRKQVLDLEILKGGQPDRRAVDEVNALYHAKAAEVAQHATKDELVHSTQYLRDAIQYEKEVKATLDAHEAKIAKNPAIAKSLGLVAMQKGHARSVARLGKHAKDAGKGMEAVSAYGATLRSMAEGYERLAKGAVGEDAHSALARATDLAAEYMALAKPAQLGGWLTRAQNAVLDFLNPSAALSGSSSLEYQQVRKTAMGMTGVAHGEVIRLLNSVATEKEQAGLLMRYIDTVDQGIGLFQSAEGLSPWNRAKPILRALALQKGEHKMVKALAQMWYPRGIKVAPAAEGKIAQGFKDLLKYGMSKPAWSKLDKEAQEYALKQAPNIDFQNLSEQLKRLTYNALKSTQSSDLISKGYIDDVTKELVQGTLDRDTPKSLAFATAAINGLAVTGHASVAISKITGDLSEDLVKVLGNMNHINDTRGLKDFHAAAMQVLNKIGMPEPMRKIAFQGLADIETDLIPLFDNATRPLQGAQVFIPRELLSSIEGKLGNIVKSADQIAAKAGDPAAQEAASLFSKMVRLYNSSLISGTLLPRPSHYVNIYVGNFAQTWLEQDFATAAAMSVESLKHLPADVAPHVPDLRGFIPKKMRDPLEEFLPKVFRDSLESHRVRMAENLGVVAERVLPGWTRSVNDPLTSALFDSASLSGKAEVALGGIKYKVDDLRKAMLDGGVLTSFASSSGLKDSIARAVQTRLVEDGDKMSKYLTDMGADYFSGQGELARAYADMADAVEIRQRVALFVINMRAGHSLEDSASLVRKSLYDWNEPMTTWEMNSIAKVFMFWGFMKKAMGQGMAALVSPYTRASVNDNVSDVLTRSIPAMAMVKGEQAYAAANLVAMQRAVKAGKEHLRGQAAEDDRTEQDALRRRMYPGWSAQANSRHMLSNMRMSETEARGYKELGLEYDHTAYSMPSFTPIEMADFWTKNAQIISAYALNDAVGGDDFVRRMAEHNLGQLSGNIGEQALDGVLMAHLKDKNSYASTGVRITRPADRAFLGMANMLMDGFIKPERNLKTGKLTGGYITTPSVAALYDLATPVSMELAGALNPILMEYGYRDEEHRKGIQWMAMSYMGLYREHLHSTKDTAKYAKKDLETKAGVESRTLRKEAPGANIPLLGGKPR